MKQADSGIIDISIKTQTTTEFGTEGAGIDLNATQDDLERQISGEQENPEGVIDPVEGTARELELDQIKE